MQRIALLTAVWRRHTLTSIFWRWTAYLRDWWGDLAEVVPVCVGTDDSEHERMALAAGAVYGNAPNEPLGCKFNVGLKLARQQDVSAVLVMGSDDIFCERTARFYRPYLKGREPYVGLKDFYYYETRDGRIGYFPGYRKPERKAEPAGSGRIIPAAYLERLGWELWSGRQFFRGEKNRGMDHSSFKRLRLVAGDCALLCLDDIRGTALSLKGQGNLWRFDQNNPRRLPWGETKETVLGRLPADLIADVLTMREESEAAA